MELAELCGGLLASVMDDLMQAGEMPRTSLERTMRMQRVLALAQEPTASALRVAMGASPLNGRTAAAHWDVICERHEVGKFAWLLGMDTETAWRYGKLEEKRK